MIKNIVLIGMMGAGKSMVAAALAKKLNRSVLSTDAMIEASEHKSIKDIFAQHGEAYFRGREHNAVKIAAARQGVIIDCGGGVVLTPENFTLLKKSGTIIFLNASPEVIIQRIKGDVNRPLVNVPNPLARIKEIYTQRLPLYNQADIVVDANDPSVDAAVVEILTKV